MGKQQLRKQMQVPEKARSMTVRSRRLGCAVPCERPYLRDVMHKENALRALDCFYKAGRRRAVL